MYKGIVWKLKENQGNKEALYKKKVITPTDDN